MRLRMLTLRLTSAWTRSTALPTSLGWNSLIAFRLRQPSRFTEARVASFATYVIEAPFGKATVPGPCPRILTLGYLSRPSVRNLGPEPSESAFTPGGAASVRKLGVGSGRTARVCGRNCPAGPNEAGWLLNWCMMQTDGRRGVLRRW